MYDYAIIGSGVSGGRIAYELTAAGAKCVLIEAGKEYGARTFPKNEMDYSTRLFWGGGLEVSADGHMGFLRAKCVGGTSIVNQALLDRFDALAWDDWRAKSGVDFFTIEAMAPHYDACEKNIPLSEVEPRHYNRNARIFTDALKKNGYGWSPLHRAQADCKLEKGSDCIVCLGGCPRESKQSSLVTTIRWARASGLELRSEFEVTELVHREDGVVVRGGSSGEPRQEIRARRAVLAAGALGNSALLLRSGFQNKLPALGTGFSCHPQFMTYALYDDPVDAHKGAFQAVKSDDLKLRQAGLKLENVFAPPIGTAMLMPGYGKSHHELMRKFRYMASMEVALRDDASGKIRVTHGGKTVIQKSMTSEDQKKARHGLKLVREFFESMGAKKIIQCEQAFGLHLMGGCPIGSDPAKSVVNPEFQVHGFKNLFAADSSIFPAAPGINPSFTVMALSQRAAGQIVKEAR